MFSENVCNEKRIFCGVRRSSMKWKLADSNILVGAHTELFPFSEMKYIQYNIPHIRSMQKYHLPKKSSFSYSSSSFSGFLSLFLCKRNLILEINFFFLFELMSWIGFWAEICMIFQSLSENVCEFDETLDYNFTHIGKLHTAKFSDFSDFFLFLLLWEKRINFLQRQRHESVTKQ